MFRRALTFVSVAVMVLASGTPAAAEDGHETRTFHGTAEVVASRVTSDPAAVGRREIVIDRAEIEQLPVQSIQELLAVLPGVGLARRGARGVQGDLNLRGSTFEQSVVMVNGIRVNNPQTGHHNLDLFIPLAAVERIEVLYGPGSAVHGPDVFGGALNIVTRVQDPVSGHIRVGENDLAGGALAGSWKGLWGAAEREVHTGFRDNTEADVNQAAAGWSLTGDTAKVDIAAMAGRRRFGAHAFYSTRYPDERERTEGELLTIGAEFELGHKIALTGALRLDRHEDDFILDRHRPDWFHNHHVTTGALLDLGVHGRWRGWRWAAGIETARDDIESTNLGDHDRDRDALFAEIGRFEGPLTFALQGRVDFQDPWGQITTGAIGGRWRISPKIAVRGSLGSSFRAPSFTDLYYQSPSTEGNPELEPERGHTVEIGLEGSDFSLSFFRRQADPVIDYLLGDDGVWRAANLGRLTTDGVEAAYTLPAAGAFTWQRFGVTWLSSNLEVDPVRSRYALSHPRFEAAWTGALHPAPAWRAGWAVTYRDPVDGGSWVALDLRLGRRILPQMWIDLEAANLFDRDITEVHGVPLPGRWVTLTATWRGGSRK